MKRTAFIIFATLSIISMSFVSCSQDTNIITNNKDFEQNNLTDSKLISEISEINESLIKDKNITRGNKPNRPGWTRKETIAVVWADCSAAWVGAKRGVNIGSKVGAFFGNPHTGAIVGGIIGGVVCAGASSWLAMPESKPQGGGRKKNVAKIPQDSIFVKFPQVSNEFGKFTNNKMNLIDTTLVTSKEVRKKIELDDETLSKISLNKESLNFGKMHNVLLSVLDGSSTIKESGILHSNDSIYNSIINSEEMKQLYNEILTNTKNKKYFNSDTKGDYIMKLFSEILEEYAEEEMDVVTIINKYSDAINASSELDENDKECIMSGLATALYSFRYWNTTFSEKAQYEK